MDSIILENTIECRICGQKFSSILKGTAKSKLTSHVEDFHKIKMCDYILNGNPWPKCACGCGKDVRYEKHRFLKYYLDHKNKVKLSEEEKKRIRHGYKTDWSKHLINKKIDLEVIKGFWEKYKNNKDINLDQISKESGYDKRTISNYWWIYNIASKEEVSRQKKLHKSVYANQGSKNGSYIEIPDNILEMCFEYLSENKNKITLSNIKSKFSLTCSNDIIYKRLCEKYERSVIRSLLKFKGAGTVSKEEADFAHVLIFYFGDKNVKTQHKIYYEKEGIKKKKFYDYLLFNTIIIEYDGTYWHSKSDTISNDEFKTKLAIENGYKIFRVSSDNSKDIEILKKIKELVDEIQIEKNRVCKQNGV